MFPRTRRDNPRLTRDYIGRAQLMPLPHLRNPLSLFAQPELSKLRGPNSWNANRRPRERTPLMHTDSFLRSLIACNADRSVTSTHAASRVSSAIADGVSPRPCATLGEQQAEHSAVPNTGWADRRPHAAPMASHPQAVVGSFTRSPLHAPHAKKPLFPFKFQFHR